MHVEDLEQREDERCQEAQGNHRQDAEEIPWTNEMRASRSPELLMYASICSSSARSTCHERLQLLEFDTPCVRPLREAEHVGLDGEHPVHGDTPRGSHEPLAGFDRENVAAVQEVGERRRVRCHPVRHPVQTQLRLGCASDETAEEAVGGRLLGLAFRQGDGRRFFRAPVGVDASDQRCPRSRRVPSGTARASPRRSGSGRGTASPSDGAHARAARTRYGLRASAANRWRA